MYDEHYGLSGRPFQLTPDPKFWFESATHRKAMAYLGYGLSQGEGFIVVTGDIGAGKTTLVGHLMATIDRERLHAIKIVSSQIEADDLLRIVATGLDVDATGLVKAQLLAQIERGLHAVARTGRRTLLIVDEAQALHTTALEELRMLSNFQAGGHALLQIFLLGQPEFRDRLHGSARLEQLRQRVIATHHLEPMGADEVGSYLHHRLKVVGWNGRPRFTQAAIAQLYAGSDGVPRRLNQLTGRVMLHGAIEQLDVIDGPDVAAVVDDMNRETPRERAEAERALRTDAQPATAALNSSAAAAPQRVNPAPPTVDPGVDLALVIEHIASIDEQIVMFGDQIAALMERIGGKGDRAAALEQQLGTLEARVEAQEAALRRILTLLIDWIESDSNRPDLAAYRNLAG